MYNCKDCKEEFDSYAVTSDSVKIQNGGSVNLKHLNCPKCGKHQITFNNDYGQSKVDLSKVENEIGRLWAEVEKLRTTPI